MVVVNRFYPPAPELQHLVKGYQIMHVTSPVGVPLQTFPFPPHAIQNLAFYLRDPIQVYHTGTGRTEKQPTCIIVGPMVSRVDFTMGYDHLIVVTFFEPGGLHALLGVPMTEFFDGSFDMSLLWNADIRQISERLRNTSNYDEMQRVVETFLLKRYRQSKTDHHPIATALRYLGDPTNCLSLDSLTDISCYSARQFERKCQQHLGMSPKLFRRLARFSKAFRSKVQRPELDWLDIATRYGYYDLRHMRKDFKEFAGVAPSLLLEEETSTTVRPYSSHTF